MRIFLGCLLAATWIYSLPAFDTLQLESTFENISLCLPFTPNTARDSIPVRGPYANVVKYRKKGDAAWKIGHPLSTVVGQSYGANHTVRSAFFLGTSLFGLQSCTQYEVRVILHPAPADSVIRTSQISTQTDFFPCAGRDIFVDSASGNDALNNGLSIGAAKRTMGAAVSLGLKPGDCVHVGSGTYYEELTLSNLQGMAGNYIRIESQAGAVIDGSDKTISEQGANWLFYANDAQGNSVYRISFAREPASLVIESSEKPAINGALFQYHPANTLCGNDLADLLANACLLNSSGSFFYDSNAKMLYAVVPQAVNPSNVRWHIGFRETGFTFRQSAYIQIRGFAFRNTDWYGVRLADCNNVVISSCIFRNIKSAVYTGGSRDSVISNYCVIESCGVAYPKVMTWIKSSQGWEMMHDNEFNQGRHHINGFDLSQAGSGCVCRHNTVDSVFNGLYMARGFSYSDLYNWGYLRNMDCYGNRVSNIADDGIEPEGAAMNLRIYGNTFSQVHNGFSDAPTTVGPVFFVRNVIADWSEGAVKSKYTTEFDQAPLFFYHNTCYMGANSVLPVSDSQNDLRDTYKNNIFTGGSAIFSFSEAPVNLLLDYNSLYLATMGTTFYRATGFSCSAPGCLSPFMSGEVPDTALRFEQHGLFNFNVRRPSVVSGLVRPYDLRLTDSSVEIDKGEIIPGINDDYIGAGPDIGAYEYDGAIGIEGGLREEDTTPGLRISPNPFNPSAQIRVNLIRASTVVLQIYDIAGRRVCVLARGPLNAGRHLYRWEAAGMPSGIYWVRLAIGARQFVRPIQLVK